VPLTSSAARCRWRSQTKPEGGQFVLHIKALHGNPFDGHTLGTVVTELKKLTGVETRRIHIYKGYRGHNHAEKSRVWIAGQGAPRHRPDPPRDEAPCRGRAGDRPRQSRAPHGPHLSRGPRRRPHQRRARRRRLQLRPPSSLAEKAVACPYCGNSLQLRRAPKSVKKRPRSVLHGRPISLHYHLRFKSFAPSSTPATPKTAGMPSPSKGAGAP
jgi:hypothetical protein